MDMEPSSKRFLRRWLHACIVLATLIVAFNALIDPYLLLGTPRISRFNAKKPAVETNERLMKAYDVLRAAPNTLILGSSMVDWGLDAQHPAWPASNRPIYNLALQGSGPYTAYRYLQHVISRRHIDLVALGLDFEFFLAVPDYVPTTPDFEARLLTTPEGVANETRNSQIVRDVLHSIVSLDALSDSIDTLTTNVLGNKSPDLISGNWSDSPFLRTAKAIGSYGLVLDRDLLMIHRFRDRPLDPRVMAVVKAILELCHSHGTRVILFINPVHADALEIFDLSHQWSHFERWKHDLLGLAVSYSDSNRRSPIPLWDFSGYNAYSTEPVPENQHMMHWFLDSTHYSRALGDVIIRRILNTGDAQFGVLLTPETLEERLSAIRAEQRLYRQRHPNDIRRVQNAYNSVVNGHDGAMAGSR